MPVTKTSCAAGLALLLLGLAASPVRAGAMLVPAGDLALRQDLEWLADRGVIRLSTSTWPLSLASIETALAAARADSGYGAEPARLAAVRAKLARLSRAAPQLDAGYRGRDYALPHGFAAQARGEQQLGAQGSLSHGAFAATLRANALRDSASGEDQEVTPDGSYLAATAFGQILAFGWLDRFWGPAHEGSTLLGNAARPVAALSLQRARQTPSGLPVLSWLGPWNYQVFAGQQDDYRAVPDTKLIGMRLTVEPLRGVELALHRTMQFGGEGRPENFSSFRDALLGRSNTTSNGSVTIDNDPANQLGGVDLRWSRPLGIDGLALYAQFIGEDEAGGLPSRNTINAGIVGGGDHGDTAWSWRFESADTRADRFWGARGAEPFRTGYTYVNGIYADGYYEHGQPLGYPIGGDGQLYRFGIEAALASGLRLGIDAYHLKLNPLDQPINRAYPLSDTLDAGALRVQLPWRMLRLDARLVAQDSDRYGRDLSGTATLSFDLDAL